MDRMASLRVCVIGDTIVDEYVQCDPLGMSQEDPTIVVTPIVTDKFVGGAGIVAAHARYLGAHSVDFIFVVGDDDAGQYVANRLKSFGLGTHDRSQAAHDFEEALSSWQQDALACQAPAST